MIVRDRETLSLIINLAIASARLKGILIHEPHKEFNLRPQIHVLIAGDKGSNKSTVLNEVGSYFKIQPYNDVSKAGLTGTIDKSTHQYIEGLAWTARNKVLILDEFEFTHHHETKPILNDLLSYTEGNQTFGKKISTQSIDISKKEGELYLRVKNGAIEIKTNFALIIGTMDKMAWRNIKLNALKSRCIPINWMPDFDVIYAVAIGQPIFKYKNLISRLSKKDLLIEISQKDYMIIYDFVKMRCDDKSLFLRVLNDVCRVFAVLGKHEFVVYELVINLKMESKNTTEELH